MAIGPQGLALTPEEIMTADDHERKIDFALKENYVEGSLKIRIQFSDHPNGLQAPRSLRVYNELVRRYRRAGWTKVEREFSAMVFEK